MRRETVLSLIHGLWLGQLALLTVLAVVLLLKKSWKNFPAFTGYALFNLVSGLILFFIYKTPKLYIPLYMLNEGISVVLGIWVVYEVFVQLFSSQAALRKLANYLLAGVLVLLVALSFAVVYTHAPGLKNIAIGISVSEQAARALEVGLLMFLFVCSESFGLHWRQHLFGIALGLGVFATVQLIAMTIWTYITSSSNGMIAIAGMIAFNVSLVLWITYFLVPERASESTEIPKPSQLEQWNRAVMELIHQ